MKTVALIPAYNASKTITGIVDRIPREFIDEIIVVDDGSIDDTYERLKELEGITLIKHEENLGYGAAQLSLYKAALTVNADYTVILHADGGHYPEEIPVMLAPLMGQEPADVVVGSRTRGIMNGAKPLMRSKLLGAAFRGSMPAYKFIANIILTAFQNICYGTRYRSFHSGFRACRRDALLKIDLEKLTSWYLFDTQFLLEVHNNGLRIVEVPVGTFYDEDAGSSAPVLRYGVRIVLFSLKYTFRRVFSWKYRFGRSKSDVPESSV